MDSLASTVLVKGAHLKSKSYDYGYQYPEAYSDFPVSRKFFHGHTCGI